MSFYAEGYCQKHNIDTDGFDWLFDNEAINHCWLHPNDFQTGSGSSTDLILEQVFKELYLDRMDYWNDYQNQFEQFHRELVRLLKRHGLYAA